MGKQLGGFLHLELESAEVDEVGSDVSNGEVDEHASDLGSSLFTSHGLHELIDEFSYLSFVIRVLWHNCWHKLSTLGVVLNHVRW